MAKLVLKNALCLVNAVDLSDHFNKITIETKFDEVDQTAFSANNYKEINQGLGDATITLHAFQDQALGSVDATLFPLSQSGASFAVEIRAVNAARSTTNVAYLMTGRLFSYNPIDASIGESSATDVVIRNAAPAGLTRATS
jgi:hypothetical protein